MQRPEVYVVNHPMETKTKYLVSKEGRIGREGSLEEVMRTGLTGWVCVGADVTGVGQAWTKAPRKEGIHGLWAKER